MSNKVTVNFRFGSLLSILGIIFITLKLIGTITWSWWWVLAPFWIPLAIFGVLFLILGIVAYFNLR